MPVLKDGLFIDRFVDLPQPFQDAMPADSKAHRITHAARYSMEDLATISILSVKTNAHPWMCPQTYLTESICEVTAWDALARFIAYGGGGCTLNSNHFFMSMSHTQTGVDAEFKDGITV